MEKKNTKLTQQKCLPCEGIGKPLASENVAQLLLDVPDWHLDQTAKLISRNYTLKNFMTGIRLINKIAEVAEAENHHPDIHLTGYKRLRIELSTHALGGLSQNDFILAAKIDQLYSFEKK